MLEVRYNTETKEVTGWCGDNNQFGNLKDRGGEAIVILDILIPDKPLNAWLYDEASNSLIENPNYIPPEPPLVFDPPSGTGVPKRLEYLEQFLEKLYPKE